MKCVEANEYISDRV